jgi:peptidoglycan/LPS O-acetylase OafA/YrhL
MAAPIQRLDPPRDESSARRFYLPELDGLRFFAFLSVFIGHVCLHFKVPSRHYPAGYGVELFFTLSAYLLTELMLREKECDRLGGLDIRAFYIRRILRIWPLYFGFLFGVLCFVLVHPIPGVSLASLAVFAMFLGDFPLAPPTSLLVVSLWSISLEEQFYLLWPHVMRRLTRGRVVAAGATLWLLTIVIRWWIFTSGHGVFWLTVITRFDSLACGVLIVGLRPKGRHVLWLVGATCWIVATAYIFSTHPNPFIMTIAYAVVAAGCGAFLLGSIGANWMRNEALVYLGRISYGLYIFHGGALLCVYSLLGPQASWVGWILCPLLALVLTIAVAAASYSWLESPFLRLKQRFQHVLSAAATT